MQAKSLQLLRRLWGCRVEGISAMTCPSPQLCSWALPVRVQLALPGGWLALQLTQNLTSPQTAYETVLFTIQAQKH